MFLGAGNQSKSTALSASERLEWGFFLQFKHVPVSIETQIVKLFYNGNIT